jgi:hypothetical protein
MKEQQNLQTFRTVGRVHHERFLIVSNRFKIIFKINGHASQERSSQKAVTMLKE